MKQVKAAFAAKVEAPIEFQYMPPGHHEVFPMGCNGVPVSVSVTEEAARALDDVLQTMIAQTRSGVASRPFFDFDHDGKAASGYPARFYWGGDDPVKGGIRCELEWSENGKSAVEGKAYEYFSPEFFLSNQDTPIFIPDCRCLGGLVTWPAFQKISRILARQDASAATEAKSKEVDSLRAQVTSLEAKVRAAEEKEMQHRETVAGEAIKAAISRGALSHEDLDSISAWRSAILANPKAINLLEAVKGRGELPVNVQVTGEQKPYYYSEYIQRLQNRTK